MPIPCICCDSKNKWWFICFVGLKPLLLHSSLLSYYDQLTIFWCFCSWEMSTLGILLGDLTPNNTPLRLGTPQCWELHRKLILLHIGHIHRAPLMEDSIVLFIAQLHWVANHRSGSRLFSCTSLGLLCLFGSCLIYASEFLCQFTGIWESGFLNVKELTNVLFRIPRVAKRPVLFWVM